jgi:hypothetical protein
MPEAFKSLRVGFSSFSLTACYGRQIAMTSMVKHLQPFVALPFCDLLGGGCTGMDSSQDDGLRTFLQSMACIAERGFRIRDSNCSGTRCVDDWLHEQ